MSVIPTNDISGFISAFAGGGVRTNLFRVFGTIPVQGFGNGESISFLCKAAQIPASSLGTIEVPYRGRRIKIPGDRTFQDWQITIISDANLHLRSAFEAWSSLFNQHVANIGDPDFYNLLPQWTVTQLDRAGNPIRSYVFVGCYPSEIGTIDLSYENNDQIAEFPVTLNYSYWVAGSGESANTTGTSQVPINPIGNYGNVMGGGGFVGPVQ